MNFVRSARFAAICGAFMSTATVALAELPTAVPTAINGSGVDGSTLVGLLAAAGAAVFIIAKILRRFGVFL